MRLRPCALLFAALETPSGPAGTSIVSSNGGHIAPEPSGLARRATFNSLPTQHLNTKQPPFIYRHLDTHPMPNGWQLELGTYASMLPTGSAAAILERFYNEVVERAKFPLAESNFYRLRSGQLALEFLRKQAPIPWALVGNLRRSWEQVPGKASQGDMRYTIYVLGKGSQWLSRSMFFYAHDDVRVELRCLQTRLKRRKEHSGMSTSGFWKGGHQDEKTKRGQGRYCER